MRPAKAVVLAFGLVATIPAPAGLRFTPYTAPPDAHVISNAAIGVYTLPHTLYVPYGLLVSPGRGAFQLGSSSYLAIPCPDVRMADVSAFQTYVVSTSCGFFAVADSVVTPAGASLPAGAEVTAMEGGLVGTSNAGVYSFGPLGAIGNTSFADVLTPANGGLPAGASVRSLGAAVGRPFVSLNGGGLFARAPYGAWVDFAQGLPAGSVVRAVSNYAAVEGRGIWRRLAGFWRPDSVGAESAEIYAISGLFASAGKAGVLRRASDGVWLPETSGLPADADARTVASMPSYAQDELFVGTNGQGLFHTYTTPVTRILPAIVTATGATGRDFRTEITIGNVGVFGSPITLSISGSDVTSSLTLAVGTELRAPDAGAWLETMGLHAGTPVTSLGVSVPVPSHGLSPAGTYVLARVYAADPSGGTYGVTLDAPTDIDAAEEEATVYGLRSAAEFERSNLAVVHVPAGRGTGPITLSVNVFSAEGAAAPNTLTRTLAAGEFFQWNDVLLQAGLPQGSSGYARISRVSGIGAWTGYGVVNDYAMSDGSVLPLFRPGGVAAARRLLVPVVLDAYGESGSRFTTEVTLANDSSKPSVASLVYRAAGKAAAPPVNVPIGAGRQLTLPDVLATLRAGGAGIPLAQPGAPQVGSLEVVFNGLEGDDDARTAALARTMTPNPDRETGGRFGVAYPAIAWGGGSRVSAIVPALAEDARTRSNLAVLNAGGGSEGPITLSVQLRDADSGADVGNPLVVTLSPGEWFQWNRVIRAAGASTAKAIATVTRVSGDDTFFAYAVLNDAKTSDGSFVRMIRLDVD